MFSLVLEVYPVGVSVQRAVRTNTGLSLKRRRLCSRQSVAMFCCFFIYSLLFRINSMCWVSVMLCACKIVMQWLEMMEKRPVQCSSSKGKGWKFQKNRDWLRRTQFQSCPTHNAASKDGQLKTTTWITVLYQVVWLLHMHQSLWAMQRNPGSILSSGFHNLWLWKIQS